MLTLEGKVQQLVVKQHHWEGMTETLRDPGKGQVQLKLGPEHIVNLDVSSHLSGSSKGSKFARPVPKYSC